MKRGCHAPGVIQRVGPFQVTPFRVMPKTRALGETDSVRECYATRGDMASGSRKVAWRLVGLALLARILTSRHFYAALAVGAITVAALGRTGKESGASTLERLAAWDRRQIERSRREAERRFRAVPRRRADDSHAGNPGPSRRART